jgi:AcrR family transcriptional regulator
VAQSTKDRILDVAEQLFSGHGFGATSMRAITNAAGVNLAAVNYHFGSKDGLVRAIFERRLSPMNEERLRRLCILEQEHGAAIPLAGLIKAFVGPALELSRDEPGGGARFVRLLGRSYTEPSETLQAAVRSMSEQVIDRFKPAFSAALPELEGEELYWRLHFLVGTLAYCMSGSNMMRLIATGNLTEPTEQERLLIRLTEFLAAGMRAPSSEEPVRTPFVVAAGHVRPSS